MRNGLMDLIPLTVISLEVLFLVFIAFRNRKPSEDKELESAMRKLEGRLKR